MRALSSLLSYSRFRAKSGVLAPTMPLLSAGFAQRMVMMLIVLLGFRAPLWANPSSELDQDDWEVSATGQALEMPGYDLFQVNVYNSADGDRSILGLIHLASKTDSGNPGKTSKCQFFASVPAGKSVEIQVPCKWDSTSSQKAQKRKKCKKVL